MKTTYTLEGNNQTGTISGLDCALAQSTLSLSLSVSACANRTATVQRHTFSLSPSTAVSILSG